MQEDVKLTQVSRSDIQDKLEQALRNSTDKSLHHSERKAAKAVAETLTELLAKPNSSKTVMENISATYNVMSGLVNFFHDIGLLQHYGKDFATDVMFLNSMHTFEGVNKFSWFVRESGTHIYVLPLHTGRGIKECIAQHKRDRDAGRMLEFEIDMHKRTVTAIHGQPTALNGQRVNNVTMASYEAATDYLFDIRRKLATA